MATTVTTIQKVINKFAGTNIELILTKNIMSRHIETDIRELKDTIKLLEDYKKHKSCFSKIGFHSKVTESRVGYRSTYCIYIKVNIDFDLDIKVGEKWWNKYSKYRKTCNKTASLLKLLKSILKGRQKYYDMLNAKVVCC